MEMKDTKNSLKNKSNSISDFILNIIANNDGGVQGEIKLCKSGETKYFRSLIEMLQLINGKLDQIKVPQTNDRIRSWVIRTK